MIELPKAGAPGLTNTDHIVLAWLARFAEARNRDDRACLLPEVSQHTSDLYPEIVGSAQVDIREALGMIRRLTERLATAEATVERLRDAHSAAAARAEDLARVTR